MRTFNKLVLICAPINIVVFILFACHVWDSMPNILCKCILTSLIASCVLGSIRSFCEAAIAELHRGERE